MIFILVILALIPLTTALAEEKNYLVKFHENKPGTFTTQESSLKKITNEIYLIKDTTEEELANNQEIKYFEESRDYTILENTPWNFLAMGVDFNDIPDNFGEGVKIAVLDTGVNFSLLDLISGPDIINGDGDASDDHGHGTLTAQLLRAPVTNFPLMGSEVYAVKVLDNEGIGQTEDIIAGLDWAIENNMDILSMSFNGPDSFLIKEKIDEAYSNGILLIASAGNSGNETILFPAGYDSVIAAGSINQALEKSSFSSYGEKLELMAPGEGIILTFDGENYFSFEGTSFSSPLVAVIAASLFSENAGTNNVEVRQVLRTTAVDLGEQGRDNFYGYGLASLSTQQINQSDFENLENRVIELENWKTTIIETISGILSDIAVIFSSLNGHESRITTLESQTSSGGNSTSDYWKYLDFRTKKDIACGFGEDNSLELYKMQDLGASCEIASTGNRIKCDCEEVTGTCDIDSPIYCYSWELNRGKINLEVKNTANEDLKINSIEISGCEIYERSSTISEDKKKRFRLNCMDDFVQGNIEISYQDESETQHLVEGTIIV